jgi:hypothetical protein
VLCPEREVCEDKLDPVRYAAVQGVMSRELKSGRVVVNGNDALACPCKLDGVAPYSAKGVDNHVALTAIGNMRRDGVRRDAKPTDVVQQEGQRVVPWKIEEALGEICL